MTDLVNLLRDNCAPAITASDVCVVRGYGSDEGIAIRSLTAVTRVACDSWLGSIAPGLKLVKATCEGVNVAAKAADILLIDPTPGDQYFIGLGAGSPDITFLGLPRLEGIDGWALRYHADGEWSDLIFKLGYGQFDFVDDVDALEFFPTDAAGNRIFNPTAFSYDIQFDRDGDVSLFQASVGQAQVSEPPTSLLTGIAVLAMIAVRFGRTRRLAAETRKYNLRH